MKTLSVEEQVRFYSWLYDGARSLTPNWPLDREPALWWPAFQRVLISVTLSVKHRLTAVEGLKYRRARPASAGPGAGVELELTYWYVTIWFDGHGQTFTADQPGEAVYQLLVFLWEQGWAWPREYVTGVPK